MSAFFELAASLSESFIIVRFGNQFLGFRDKRFSWLKSAVYFILISALNVLFSQRDGYELISFGVHALITLGYVMLFLNGNIIEKILIVIVPIVTILSINLISMNIFRVMVGCYSTDIITPGGKMRVPVLVFSKLAFFFACEFLIHVRRHNQYALGGFQWALQIACFIMTIFISILLWNISVDNDDLPMYFLASIAIGILNIMLYVVMYKMQRDNAIKEEYEISLVNLAAQERFVNEARERYMEMRTVRHDMRHYLMTVAGLIADEKIMEARQYIEKILDEKVNQAVYGIYTGSVVVDAVINNKNALCLKNNIKMKCLIDSQFTDINETDVSILLSNVLDNAVNGCAGAEEPHIELMIGTRKSFTYIIVKNSIRESVLSGNPELKTNKDKSVHGFGVMSVQKIAEKYGGNVEFREEGNEFITEIWLERNINHV